MSDNFVKRLRCTKVLCKVNFEPLSHSLNSTELEQDTGKMEVASGSQIRPLAAVLRDAEDYMRLCQEMDNHLRAGFVGLTGSRMSVRNGALLIVPDTWPQASSAEVTVMEKKDELNLESANTTKEETIRTLRQWNGGFKPSADLLSAKKEFETALALSLRIASLKRKLNV